MPHLGVFLNPSAKPPHPENNSIALKELLIDLFILNFYSNFQNTSNMQGQTFNNFQRPFYSSFQRPSFFNNTSPFGLSMYSRGGIGGFLPFF